MDKIKNWIFKKLGEFLANEADKEAREMAKKDGYSDFETWQIDKSNEIFNQPFSSP